MAYQWDIPKARRNLAKHGIDFADAVSVYEDEWALSLEDQEIGEEDRLVTIGSDARGRVLVVTGTYRGHEMRLISARRATPRERKQYETRIRL